MKYSLRSRMIVAIPVALLAGLGVAFVPCSREAASFVCVSSPDKYTDEAFGHYLPGRPNGDFIVHDNKLYLKVQGVRQVMGLVTAVRSYEWSPEKLARLRAEHTELEPYFPDATKPNGGIAWISVPNSQAPAPNQPKP